MPDITITHDGLITIAEGRNRRETSWRNREWQWSALVARLSETQRTHEKYAEYVKMKPGDQGEIKDVGGFVGGVLTQGRRKAGSVAGRQLLTLDIDYGHAAQWADFTMIYEWAACMYSTHKHSPAAPRLRLVLPLDREVTPAEYVAIARRIAGLIGIEYFDHTTYEPHRLMYWPSTAKDGVYVFEVQDGPWLKADEMLSKYRDWRDSSQWPMSSRETGHVHREIKKQTDPLEKSGVVGAFCRAYGIEEAIEAFLSDIYASTDVDGRYTFAGGSTAGGLVIYEGKYAFSHHGTDPTSGRLCNAFDLVRIHLFGLKDEDAAAGAPSNKLPSYAAMLDLARSDRRVKTLLGAERLAEAREDFGELPEFSDPEISDEPVSDEWLADMDVDKHGNYQSTINNVLLVMANDPYLRGRFALDAFERREVALKDLPWRKITYATRYLIDADDASIRHYLEKAYRITGVNKVEDALKIAMLGSAVHPVREYLEGLEWDGVDRIDTLLIDYLGARDNEYVRAVTRKTLVAAVTRIYRPGVKFDNMLTIVGAQGIGKSSLIGKLGGKWFSDSLGDLKGKEPLEQIQGVWLVEMGELAGLRKADVETIKHFLSKREDRYRVAYGKRTENFPRQCVFFGTTNTRDFLRDPSGNRRFWPVDVRETEPVRSVFTDLTPAEVGQIWAEAVVLYQEGEALHLSPELEEMAAAEQAAHSEHDERTGMIEKYLDTLLPEKWEELGTFERRAWLAGDELQVVGTVQRNRVCVGEIWCEVLGGHAKDMSRYNTKDIHDMMRTIAGWEPHHTKIKHKLYGVQKGYIRVNDNKIIGNRNAGKVANGCQRLPTIGNR